ncbi:MAG: menaquinone biosynthetic enzyme MqnA/MqnD family protein [Acidobacteriota bacterium]
MKPRVSFIDFLNSVPLGWGFLHGSHRGAFEVLFDVPSQCAEHLRTGQADIGLIPAIEYQNIPGLRILPDISIASKREVKSVLFASRLSLKEVSRVAVDSSSRTSVALLKIVLETFHGNRSVSYTVEPPDPSRILEGYDAALVIGNPALKIRPGPYRIHDLAAEWNRFVGLPFVFAFWAVREDFELGEQSRIFYESRDEGLANVEEIARIYSEKLAIPQDEIRRYIRENLSYWLGEADIRGLEEFYRLAEEIGIIEKRKPLHFLADQSRELHEYEDGA